QQCLEEREHAIGLPLLIADEADALALERCESRRVRLPRLEPAGRVMEFERDHGFLLVVEGLSKGRPDRLPGVDPHIDARPAQDAIFVALGAGACGRNGARAMRRVELRGGARRQPARRTFCTLSRLSRAPYLRRWALLIA